LDGAHDVVTQDDDELVDATGWDLAKLAVELAKDATGHFIVSVVAIAATQNGDRVAAAESLSNVVLDVQPVPDATVERAREGIAVKNKIPEIDNDGPRLAPARTRSSGSAAPSDRRPVSLDTASDRSPGRKSGAEANPAGAQAPGQQVVTAKDGGDWPDSHAPVSARGNPKNAEAVTLIDAPRSAVPEQKAKIIVDRAQEAEVPAREQSASKSEARRLDGPGPVAQTQQVAARMDGPATASPVAKTPMTESPPVAEPVSGTLSEPGIVALVDRAQRLIRLGDISGARLLLERAVARGDRRAAFFLAQTYDPEVLRSWKARGLPADPERARALYSQAEQAGINEAKVTERQGARSP
jgi:hypothetical protein